MAFLSTISFIIYMIAAILMIFAILLQEGKGGGLAGLGGAHVEATFGATNPLRRFTVVMAVLFLFLASFIDYASKGTKLKIKEEAPPPPASTSTAEPGAKPAEQGQPAEAPKPAETTAAPAPAEATPAPAAPATAPAPAKTKSATTTQPAK
jgi:protein translocase SecG subunit